MSEKGLKAIILYRNTQQHPQSNPIMPFEIRISTEMEQRYLKEGLLTQEELDARINFGKMPSEGGSNGRRWVDAVAYNRTYMVGCAKMFEKSLEGPESWCKRILPKYNKYIALPRFMDLHEGRTVEMDDSLQENEGSTTTQPRQAIEPIPQISEVRESQLRDAGCSNREMADLIKFGKATSEGGLYGVRWVDAVSCDTGKKMLKWIISEYKKNPKNAFLDSVSGTVMRYLYLDKYADEMRSCKRTKREV